MSESTRKIKIKCGKTELIITKPKTYEIIFKNKYYKSGEKVNEIIINDKPVKIDNPKFMEIATEFKYIVVKNSNTYGIYHIGKEIEKILSNSYLKEYEDRRTIYYCSAEINNVIDNVINTNIVQISNFLFVVFLIKGTIRNKYHILTYKDGIIIENGEIFNEKAKRIINLNREYSGFIRKIIWNFIKN